jgi:hypothetical protein
VKCARECGKMDKNKNQKQRQKQIQNPKFKKINLIPQPINPTNQQKQQQQKN